ncbi:uncharacterized protein LOC123467060 isoform X2 [Daphnia magna]|uniref:uncharacterized protein LOC123467060 isoform X2 n=1 Tax=Daphnia magna TaxID=35525 RepID=UPI001E1BC55B|nr:uncharacterized protein LOC123467060 isoform X2 [Daphnia magna]
MDSQIGLTGKFFIVDLIDGNNHRHVTVVPDIWIFQADDNSSKCWYPKISGHISSKKREVPKPCWYVYPCIVRKEYDSYESARSQEHIASIQSDINTEGEDDASQPNTSLGKGKRHKRPNKRFLPSSDDESVGVYGPTQPETIVIPTIPVSLLRNSVDGGVPAVRPTAPLAVQRRCNNSVDDPGVSGPTHTEAIVIPMVPVSLLRNSVGGVPAALPMTPFEVQQSCSNSFEEVSQHMRGEITVNSTDDNSPVSYNNLYSQEMPYSGTIGNQRMSVAVPNQSNILSEEMPNGSTRNVFLGNQRNQSNTLTDGSVALIGKLVREVLKLQEFISNMMAKLVVMESKMESHRQPVAETLANPEFLLEPLQEMEEIQALEESLRDPDLYFQLVGMIRSLGGASIRDALKRAWYRVFSIKVMASVNWEGKIKKGSLQKQGLKQSIVTKAVFDGVRTTSRKSNNFELETETKKIMKGMPEKYRKRCATEKLISNEYETDSTLNRPGTSADSE